MLTVSYQAVHGEYQYKHTSEYYALKSKAKEAGMNLSLFIRNALQGCEIRQ